ncbi:MULTISPECIES: helix-turn-helix domain-containing protein [unclassified Clostridioides]|uniref:helix-turn-helix domain-containing protein n=1 Tax=unclassified Clostridioides TaxID=2635829 RepID=UPI001D128C64|nr:helix-turn-helix transcriptional regulator [Clostridioides sp. ES-W-0018-02]MCC0705136.1 helix-turn-helix transcriptional regulator [Clostridioides sp. ES-S-0049-02]MCC0713037.1 helix-turn-helix transcriptional regulator [Clostridioides sp. ES-W-0017-02]
MINNQTLGDKIKSARKNKGLKQSELSNLLGIRNTTVSSWENNSSKPDINILELLCGILDVSPNFFFNTDNKENITIKELELIRKYRLLDNRGKDTINSLIDIQLSSSDNYFKE